MDDKEKMAFEFAQECTKQFLTLATGIIALTITFSKDFLQGAPPNARPFAYWSWGFFLVSVSFGLLTLMALTGTLQPLDRKIKLTIQGKNIRTVAGLQIMTFFAGLLFVVLFGAKAVR